MKILIISGLLGAGKTTFIKELVKNTKKDFVILENEYGGVNVDRQILEEEPEMNVWEMTEGCVCCSMKADFAASVLTVENALNPDYLIVEPTGLAQLGNVMDNLSQLEYDRIQLLPPITIVDSLTLQDNHKRFLQLFEDQVKLANTIILSKSENLDTFDLELAQKELSAINPNATITSGDYSKQANEWWIGLLENKNSSNDLKGLANDFEINLDRMTITDCKMQSVEQLIIFLDNLLRGFYGEVVRGKGFVSIGKFFYHFEVADGRYSITESENSPQCECVIIGWALNKAKLQYEFNLLKPMQLSLHKTLIKPLSFK